MEQRTWTDAQIAAIPKDVIERILHDPNIVTDEMFKFERARRNRKFSPGRTGIYMKCKKAKVKGHNPETCPDCIARALNRERVAKHRAEAKTAVQDKSEL